MVVTIQVNYPIAFRKWNLNAHLKRHPKNGMWRQRPSLTGPVSLLNWLMFIEKFMLHSLKSGQNFVCLHPKRRPPPHISLWPLWTTMPQFFSSVLWQSTILVIISVELALCRATMLLCILHSDDVCSSITLADDDRINYPGGDNSRRPGNRNNPRRGQLNDQRSPIDRPNRSAPKQPQSNVLSQEDH